MAGTSASNNERPSNYAQVSQTVYHRQNNDSDCGEACMQMLLASLVPTKSASGVLHSQETLADVQRGHTAIDERFGWGTNPLDMVWTLNYYALKDGTRLAQQISDGSGRFELIVRDSEKELSKDIRQAVQNKELDVPPIVLVWGKGHWVVVYGLDYISNVDPNHKSDEVTGFYIHNSAHAQIPEPPTNALVPQNVRRNPFTRIHTFDDACGTGDSWNFADTRVGSDQWHAYWDTGVDDGPNGLRSHWHGKHLAVVFTSGNDNHPASGHHTSEAKKTDSGISAKRISHKEAMESAETELHNLGLYGAPQPWSGWLDLKKTMSRQAFYIGNRLPYYLVEMVFRKTPKSRVRTAQVLAMIHAETKELLATAVIKPDPEGKIIQRPYQVMGMDIKESLSGQRIKLSDREPHLVRPSAIRVEEASWEYSPTSRNPFFPLQNFRIRGVRLSIPLFTPLIGVPLRDGDYYLDLRPFRVDPPATKPTPQPNPTPTINASLAALFATVTGSARGQSPNQESQRDLPRSSRGS